MADHQDHIQVRADLFHDLANMLVVVLGSLDLLDRQHLDPEARRQLDRAQQGTERGAELVRQMFAAPQSDHARRNIEAGLMTPTAKLHQ